MLCEQTVPQTDMTKQTVTFCDFVYVPKNISLLASLQLTTYMPFLVPQRHSPLTVLAPTIHLCQHLQSSIHALG
jgi:hypothetical protein